MTPELPGGFGEGIGRHWDKEKIAPYLLSLRKTSREHESLWIRHRVASLLLSDWQDFQSAVPVLIFLSSLPSESEVGGKSLSKILLEDFFNHDLGFYDKGGSEPVRRAWEEFWEKNQRRPLVEIWKDGIREAIQNYIDRENLWVPSRSAFRIALLKGIPETALSDGEKRRDDPVMAKALLEKEQHDLRGWWEATQRDYDYVQGVINGLRELAYRDEVCATEYLGLGQLHFAIGLFGAPYRGNAEREVGAKPRESTVVERLQYLKKVEEYYSAHRQEIQSLQCDHTIEVS